MSEKGAPHSFTNLDFYQQARALAVDAFNLARKLPKDDATRVVSRQLIAAVTSIRANIAEGASLTRAMISLGDAGATPRLREDAASYVLGAPTDGNYYDEKTDAPMLPCSHAPGGPE